MSYTPSPPTEAQHVLDAMEQLSGYTADDCYRGLTAYSNYAIAAAAVALAETNSGSEGGTMTLADLSDVSGTPAPGKGPVYENADSAVIVPVTTTADLDAVLSAVAAVDWHDIGAPGEPPFQSSFRNIGDPWSPARYRMLANSTVRLQGTVTSDDQTIADATWVPLFTLPPEAAPDYSLEFCALTNDNAFSKLIIWANGDVIWGGYVMGPHAPISRLPLNFLSWSTAGPEAALMRLARA